MELSWVVRLTKPSENAGLKIRELKFINKYNSVPDFKIGSDRFSYPLVFIKSRLEPVSLSSVQQVLLLQHL